MSAPAWHARFAARTPEEADRRRFGLWALAALIVLLPLWWLFGADLAAALLRPVASGVLGLFGLGGGVRVGEDGGWIVGTGLAMHGETGAFDLNLSRELVRRLFLGVPLFAAFMIAPPHAARPWRAALIGAVGMAVLFLVSLVLVCWGEIAPLLDPDLPASRATAVRPAGEPLAPLVAQVVLIGRYLALSAAPLAVAVILWAVLNPAGRHALLGALEAEPSTADVDVNDAPKA